MKKKFLIAGLCVAMGVVMLISTAFASMSGSSGYEIYKSALKNTAHTKSLTGNFSMSIKDNGKSIADAETIMKSNRQEGISSHLTVIKAGEQEKIMESYRKDGTLIVRENGSDVYNVIQGDPEKGNRFKHRMSHDENEDPEVSKAGELVLDALVGDLKNYVTAGEKADGGSEVTVQLSGNQIPAVANALTSLALRSASEDGKREKAHMLGSGEFSMDINHPELVEDIRITNINLTADINKDNLIEKQAMDITVSGRDKDGNAHKVEISIDMDLSGFNNTTPDAVDLTGKQVKTIDREELRDRHGN